MFQTALRIEQGGATLEDRADAIECASARILVVADGAGGRPGGAAAAEAAVRSVAAAVPQIRPEDADAWSRLLQRIDDAIAREPAAGETTAVIAAVTPGGVAGASVGDSGAWLVGPDGFLDLTERQQRKPGLGTGGAVPRSFRARVPGGTLLVATDGLFRYADPEAICAAAREACLDTAADRLLDLVRRPSGGFPDDVAVILCRTTGPEAAVRSAPDWRACLRALVPRRWRP